MDNPDIKICVCRGGYSLEFASWGESEEVPISGGMFVAVSVDEVLRLVRTFIEQADAIGADRAREQAEDALKGK